MTATSQFPTSRADALSMWDDMHEYQTSHQEDDVEYVPTAYAGKDRNSIRIRNIDHMPRNAWMSPDGTLYHVDDFDHSNVAYYILGDKSFGDGLEDNGWLHISTGLALYVTSRRPNITDAQMSTLWDIYMQKPDVPVAWMHAAIRQLQRLLNINVAS